MHEVSLALVWHQHQPYYLDDVSGQNPMPWVRLHGTKDYWGMAMHLREIPELHATINLVPSLLAQIRAYTDEGHEDAHLRVSRLPADGLSEADLIYLLDNFFMVHPDQMIRPYRRYHELYQQRGLSVDSAQRAMKRFSTRDILDLQCWNNLVWIHPIAFEVDADLADFRDKGGRWTESEKAWLLEKQLELLGQIIPLHRELQDRGQVELSTTPFYHPILPLMWDKMLARQAMPDVVLPSRLEPYPEDGVAQIRRAVDYHEQLFGERPRGMWPSEGSVCQAMIPALAAAGIEWIATDEEILSCSTAGWISRDAQGHLRNPEMLYRPWRAEEAGKHVEILFRDHAMSDQIGFNYQRSSAQQAADDFIGRLEAIGRATKSNAGQRPTLVSIILDGENCWEYYPNGGVEFLRTLYQRIVQHAKVSPVRVSDYLEDYPATDKIDRLFSGSWISHNFGIWIGHPECNRAWDLVGQTREHLVSAAARREELDEDKPTDEQFSRAWEELYIAEGSDWFWWFGDSHSSAQDSLFDQLFRKHLQNVYLALGDVPPGELLHPIHLGRQPQRPYTQPTGLLDVKIDGRRTYFEWINAGYCPATGSRGTMSMVDQGLLDGLYFGFDNDRLLVRVDARGGALRDRLADVDTVRLAFIEPPGCELLISQPGSAEPIWQLYRNDVPVSAAGVEAAVDAILEVAIPWRSLAVTTDEPVQFYVELVQNELSLERLPAEGAVETLAPSPDYELIMWQA